MSEDSFNSKDLTPQSHTPVPKSSVSQASESHKLTRSKTSEIYQHVTIRNNRFHYNRYSKSYSITGDTANITRHLKQLHSIDPAISTITKKRIREGTAIDIVILHNAEINIKANEQRRKEIMGIKLDKITLEYLYLQ